MKPKIDLERLKFCINAISENPQYCSNGTCVWPKPTGGMHTNGGCHCLTNIKDVKLRRAINAVSESFKALPELITALEEAREIIKVYGRVKVSNYDEEKIPESCANWLAHFEGSEKE